MKMAVCIPPAACDSYRHHTAYAEQLAAVGAQRSFPVEILHFSDRDFLPRLFANLAAEDCIIHFHSFLYDLRLLTAPADETVVHALDSSRAVTLATISDHPFTDFMQKMVRHAHPATKFLVVDDCFVDEMRFINAALDKAKFIHRPFVAPLNFDPTQVTPFANRTFDLVVPLYLTDLKRNMHTVLSGLPKNWVTEASAAAYEEILADICRSPFHIFENCVSERLHGLKLHEVVAQRPEVGPALLNMLNIVDGFARQERRHRMVRSLLRSVGDLKVAVLSDPIVGLDVDERVVFVGAKPTCETTQLMAKARAVLNCNPTYPGNIHERVSVGMLYESCVITDVNPCIARHFSDEEYVPYELDSTQTIEEIFATHDVAGVAAAASAKTRSASQFSWDAHFDGLLEAAAA